MEQKSKENPPFYQKVEHRHFIRLLSLIGLILLCLGLLSWVLSTIQKNRDLHTPLTGFVPSGIFGKPGQSGGGCFETDPSFSLRIAVPSRKPDQTTRNVTLFHPSVAECNTTETWSGRVTEGATWLSIYPAQGLLIGEKPQSVLLIITSKLLNIGEYHGTVEFDSRLGGTRMFVSLKVVPASLADTVAYTPLSDLSVVARWPHLVKSQSSNVSITLASLKILSRVLPSATRSMLGQNALKSLEKFLPNEELRQDNTTKPLLLESSSVYGPFPGTYDQLQLVGITAQLIGTTFDISQTIPPSQSAEQTTLDFRWNILPKEAGPQNLVLSLAGLWKPQHDAALQTIYFLAGQLSVSVDATPVPFIVPGQITLSEIIIALIASVLNIPWIIEKIEKRRKNYKKSLPTPPTNSPKTSSRQPRGRKRKR
jgi:hypothetical protein